MELAETPRCRGAPAGSRFSALFALRLVTNCIVVVFIHAAGRQRLVALSLHTLSQSFFGGHVLQTIPEINDRRLLAMYNEASRSSTESVVAAGILRDATRGGLFGPFASVMRQMPSTLPQSPLEASSHLYPVRLFNAADMIPEILRFGY